MSDGMFLTACRGVAKEFPEITYDEDLLDRVCLQVCHILFRPFVTYCIVLESNKDNAKPQTIWGACHGYAQPVRRYSF